MISCLSDGEESLERAYSIYVQPTPTNFVVLSGAMTLEQVHEKHCKAGKPLEMYYGPFKEADEPK